VPDSDPSDKKLVHAEPAPPVSVGIGPDCRARRMEHIKESANCRVSRAQHCPYAMTYGSSRFCRHPQRELIIDRTEAACLPSPL
jgi:hypothetical protein